MLNCGREMNWRNDPHTCWTISAIVSYVQLKIFQVSSMEFEPMTSAMLMQCSYQLSYEGTRVWRGQSVGLVFLWKEWWVKEVLVKCGWEINWRNDTHTCWAISAIVSYVHLKNSFYGNTWAQQIDLLGVAVVMCSNLIEDTWKFCRCTWDNCWDCPVGVRIISSIDSL